MTAPLLCSTALLALAVSAGTTAGAAAHSESVDLFYVGEQRLIVLRVHVSLDDNRTHQDAWRQSLNQFFKDLDANSDGSLSRVEADAVPIARQLPWLEPSGPVRSVALGRNQDGKTSPDELAAYFREIGLLPLALRIEDRSPMVQRQAIAGGPAQRQTPELFDQLDTDKDGALTKAEVHSALHRLHKMDLDDDETISLEELAPLASLYGFAQQNEMVGTRERVVRGPMFTSLATAGSPQRLANQLASTRQLDRKYLGQSEEVFRRFDGNKNGRLDFNELLQFAQQPEPLAEIRIRLGKVEPSRPSVEIIRSAPGLNARISQAGQEATLVLDDLQLVINFSTVAEGDPLAEARRHLAAFDRDNNKYLEQKELGQTPDMRLAFELMDRDQDGKVFENELATYVKRQSALSQSLTRLRVGAPQRNLFEMIDANRDGRLRQRELESIAGRLAIWDANRDGKTVKSELPVQFHLSVQRGAVALFGGLTPAPAAGNPRPARGGGPQPQQSGPIWFQRMDRNQDGEVSRREFLGPPERFRELDGNNDGALDPGEAILAK